MLNKLKLERKVGTRKITGPENCPVARMIGCKPNNCPMIKMDVNCPLAPIEVEPYIDDSEKQ